MNAKALALNEYVHARRRLNSRLGLLMFALIPLPMILLRAAFQTLQMLATVTVLAAGAGIVYPMWWRSKHHPCREHARERCTRMIALTCRTVALVSFS